MALVKKLEPGGPVNNNGLNINVLNDQINKVFPQYNLSSKDEENVRAKVAQLRDADLSGNITFAGDPVTRKYTISGPGSEVFTGSPTEIHAN
jgi:hypothetical protein